MNEILMATNNVCIHSMLNKGSAFGRKRQVENLKEEHECEECTQYLTQL